MIDRSEKVNLTKESALVYRKYVHSSLQTYYWCMGMINHSSNSYTSRCYVNCHDIELHKIRNNLSNTNMDIKGSNYD